MDTGLSSIGDDAGSDGGRYGYIGTGMGSVGAGRGWPGRACARAWGAATARTLSKQLADCSPTMGLFCEMARASGGPSPRNLS